ncbi:protein HAPLESS 2 isoform X2 [Citrus sinensis]|uniref:protein HAPLESS 2 isoform X2 n=1 Tax=Citrus sinensis TaxID=2711 RepID=UPI000CED101A|nr:protein HAPLESS 2 isoform X2 [Citrus sinensis]XP_024045321.1 protein HAPLESS 2 isoform X1 [Citrus x clementina]
MRNQTKSLKLKHFLLILFCILNLLSPRCVVGVQILSKSKLEKCEKRTDSDNLNCTTKIVLNMAVPSGSSGGEASIVAEVVEVEENSTQKMRTVRIPPVLTVNKTASYAVYELTYIRDVPYKPQEFYMKTRKCEPDAGADVVKICERLRDENGHIIEHTEPICCPCGPQRRIPSSCGNVFDKLLKGKANTAHCLRFPGDWFHVFGIGQRSIGFSVRIEVKTGSKVSEVTVGPENRTATSADNFLKVNLIGDFVGYTNIPSFEEFYLVIPRQGGPGQPQDLGGNFSMWMLLERTRFTLDGLECNKIGVSYEAFNGQPSFCSSPFWSCLHNQLWNYREADQNRINRNQLPLYGVEGRFERMNQHPNAGSHSFSIGVTEVLNSNLLIELRADDIEYVYQRSPGKIISVIIPTFEALTQFGVATITTQNTGEVEASYSLTFDCSTGVTLMEEQYFIIKPKETSIRSFKIYPTTNQAAKYTCSAILKDSDFSEVDRAECQFSTMATVLDNGSQITPFQPPKSSINDFFESIESIGKKLWEGLRDFITGKACRRKCSSFFDFSCHIQYICLSWLVLFGLVLAIFPTVLVLLWLLHQKGLFDPLYDWWDDHFQSNNQRIRDFRSRHIDVDHPHVHVRKHHKQEGRHHKLEARRRRSGIHSDHKHKHSDRDTDYYYYLHHVQKDKHKHGRSKNSSVMQQLYLDTGKNDHIGHHRRRKFRESS